MGYTSIGSILDVAIVKEVTEFSLDTLSLAAGTQARLFYFCNVGRVE
jgi:hypothetical protein